MIDLLDVALALALPVPYIIGIGVGRRRALREKQNEPPPFIDCAHVWSKWEKVHPEDSKDFQQRRQCEFCQKIEVVNQAPKTWDCGQNGHRWGKWEPIDINVYNRNGGGKLYTHSGQTRRCNACGYKQSEKVITK